MLRSRILACIFIALTSGCTTVPQFDIPKENGRPSVRSIVDRIRCELGQLVREDYPYRDVLLNGDFVVALQLSLTVNDDGSLAPSFEFIKNPMFSFNFGLKFEASREQNYTQQLIFSLKQMKEQIIYFQKNNLGDPYPCDGPNNTWLAGELGLKTSADIALRSPNLNLETKLSGTDGAFGGSVNFTITKNLNAVGPTWTLRNFKGPGGFAGLSEVNTDKLSFAFAQSSATGAIPTAPKSGNAQILLNQILTGDISTQLRGIRSNLR